MDESPPPSRSWSIYTRREITTKYEILDRVGSGAYADVYRARRLSDGLTVALKEIHDYQSAFREIEALQILQNSPNIITLYEYFWREDEDAVLVLEFLETDLASVIHDAKKNREGGISVGEIKRWMIQILQGVDACHRNYIVHRDLKPSNLLISAGGVLKLADFGQSRILLPEPPFPAAENSLLEEDPQNQITMTQHLEVIQEAGNSCPEGSENITVELMGSSIQEESYLKEIEQFKVHKFVDETEKETNYQDGDASCLATCTTSDVEEDLFKTSCYSYDAEEEKEDKSGAFTSCVGTRWFRAPELLYGSTNYGQEIDLWSLGCVFAELFSLQPLFPGNSDIDQIGRIINVLGNIDEETWPGCSKLPDYGKIFFNKVENPLGLEPCLPNGSASEIGLVNRLVCYDPMNRATAMELLQDRYLNEDPLPVPVSELRVPSSKDLQDEASPRGWGDYNDPESDSDLGFTGVDIMKSDAGFSIRFL
ncbi:cyclin-dependent kinase F-1 [Aristolochia californica]|uniref:cyclin-dependent kinase F-1 n=1 Tax=Aristolochia californica TaxID=171875 RepID=UPI0035E390AF